jgi:hypothetical protein
MTPFYEYFQLYNQPQEIRSDCNELTIVNTGTAIAIVDGLELNPGDQYISPGNIGEINKTRYRISFIAPGTEQVLVIRKIYQ